MGFSAHSILEEEGITVCDVTRKKKEIVKKKKNSVKMKRNLKRRKRVEIVIGTLNVVSLNGKVEEIVDMMKERKINILGLSECKWKESGEKILRDGYKIWWSGGNEGRNGVGMVVCPKLRDYVLDIKCHNDRLMEMKLKVNNSLTIEIIQLYAPQSGKTVEEKDGFLAELEQLLERNTRTALVMGDFNAKVGSDRTGFEDVLGKFGSGEKNRDGAKMLEMCNRNGLQISNSWFAKRRSHQITRYGYGEDRTESIIDYICIGKEIRKFLADVKACPMVSIDSDHRLLEGKLKVWMQKSITNVSHKRIKVWQLQNARVKREFCLLIGNKMPTGDLRDVEVEWNEFKKIFVKGAEQVCGRAGGRKKEKATRWWNDRVRSAVREKRQAWQKYEWQRTNDNEKEYKELKKNVEFVVSEEKEKSMAELAEKLEIDFEANKKMLYGIIKGKRERREDVMSMKDDKGELICDAREVLRIWKEYFENLLNVQSESIDITEDELENRIYEETENEKEDEISEGELMLAIRAMKNGRAPGIDEVAIEMIKAAGEMGRRWIGRVIQAAWIQKKIPEDWKKGVIVPIFKKGDKRVCGNYRGVTLLCQCAKLYEKILEKRLKDNVEEKLREEQFGFRRGRSTIDAIFIMRQIMERKWEKDQTMHMAFLDLEKAYDRLPREKVWNCLEKKEVGIHIIERIKSTYDNSISCVQTTAGFTEWFPIKEGVRQGSVLSPTLFVIVMDELLRKVEPHEEEDARTLIYADDVVVWGDTREEVQNKIDKWSEETEKMGLRVSAEKSESMTVERKVRHGNIGIKLRNGCLKEVKEFKYLGSVLTNQAKLDADVRERVKKAEMFYQSVRKLLWNELIPRKCKLLMFKMYFVPILTYGAVTWAIGGKEESKIQAAEMKFLRSIRGVTKMDKIRSNEIRSDLGVESLSFKIGRERLRWFGHMKRMDERKITRREFENTAVGRRRVGRPRERWSEKIEEDVERRGKWSDVKEDKLWENRERWKELVERLEETNEAEEEEEEDGEETETSEVASRAYYLRP
jgi:hypothetical protein